MQGVGSSGYQEKPKPQLPDLVFVMSATIKEGYDVYAIDTNGGCGDDSKPSIKRLFNFKPSRPELCCDDMRMVVCGSKLCAVGASFDDKINKFPREYLQFDLTNWRNRDADDFKPDNTPKPKGAKPSPAVFVHNNHVYALAGMCYPDAASNFDIPNPAFEVYDPFGDGDWKPLKAPPFQESYDFNKPTTLYLRGHNNVIDQTLYVLLFKPLEGYIYYAYSIDCDDWKEINVDNSDTLVANLTLYGKYSRWHAREVFNGYTGFHLSGTKVLVRNLTAEVDESKIQNGPKTNFLYYDDDLATVDDCPFLYPITVDDYPFLAVSGLDHVHNCALVPCEGKKYTFGFVAHLGANIFCAVYFVTTSCEQQIHACKFELHELRAHILGCADFYPDFTRYFRFQWGKMESKSSYLEGCLEELVYKK